MNANTYTDQTPSEVQVAFDLIEAFLKALVKELDDYGTKAGPQPKDYRELDLNLTLVLSNFHLPKAFAIAVEEEDIEEQLFLAPLPHGYWAWVPKEPIQAESTSSAAILEPIFELARKKGVRYLRFDDGGDIVDGLPTYDW
jgi:hypothetical protein